MCEMVAISTPPAQAPSQNKQQRRECRRMQLAISVVARLASFFVPPRLLPQHPFA